MIRHIVLFSLHDSESPEAEALLASLRALPAQITEIRGLMLGRTINESRGHQFALTVDVDDADALARYREHPDHIPVVERLGGLSLDIVVADIAD